jgi:hypothetical protein
METCANCGEKVPAVHSGGDANIPQDAALCSACELVETTAYRVAQAQAQAAKVVARAAQMTAASAATAPVAPAATAPVAPASGGSA